MSRRILAAAAMFAALTACEQRPEAGARVETGESPADTAATPPGYSGMERDTTGAGERTGQTGEMDSFRLKQETGQDTGGYSGAERTKPGGDTAAGQR